MKKLVVFFTAVFLFVFLLTACSNNSVGPVQEKKSEDNTSAVPQSGGKINIGVTSAINLDPLKVQTDEEKSFVSLIYEGLVKIDGQGRIKPALAKAWEISGNGRTYTFKLMNNVKWHDGGIFSSNDIKATFDRIRQIKSLREKKDKVKVFPEFDNIESYSATDADTFTVNLFKPDAGFLYGMTIGILPASSISLEKGQTGSPSDKSSDTQQILKPSGTGKYKVVKQDSDTIELKKNEDYYGKKPYIDEIAIRIFPDINSMKEAFKNREVDIMPVDTQDWGIFQNMPNVSLLHYPSRYFEFMALNLKNDLFSDVGVRQAILMSIDRNKILQDTTLGRGIIVDSPVMPFSWAYNPQVRHQPFNREKAGEMLKSAGWKDEDGDGILEKKVNGKKKKFEFELLVNTSNAARYQVASDIQKDLKEVGISVKMVNVPWEELKTRVMGKKFDAAIMGWKLSPNPDLRFMFLQDEIKNGYNFVSYSNPQLDEILIKAQSINLEQEQKALLYQAQEIISRDQPYIFLYSPNNLLAINARIKGFQPDPVNLFNNIDDWWVE
ncbi:MAG: peptide/nickel transport system substrate-binding protein [Thermoanaerobacteraceae bacterium]|nr:peptide/nickel transport system substrate-binding protein [Thermoanaerobacteraceae bacterium]